MNKYAPKADFLKAQAVDLKNAGLNMKQVARALGIDRKTAYSWLNPRYRARMAEQRVVEQTILVADRPPVLPNLQFVPHITLSKDSKYQMVRHA